MLQPHLAGRVISICRNQRGTCFWCVNEHKIPYVVGSMIIGTTPQGSVRRTEGCMLLQDSESLQHLVFAIEQDYKAGMLMDAMSICRPVFCPRHWPSRPQCQNLNVGSSLIPPLKYCWDPQCDNQWRQARLLACCIPIMDRYVAMLLACSCQSSFGCS